MAEQGKWSESADPGHARAIRRIPAGSQQSFVILNLPTLPAETVPGRALLVGGIPPLWGGVGDLNNDRAAVPRIMRIETSLLRDTSGVPPCFMGGLPIEISIFVSF